MSTVVGPTNNNGGSNGVDSTSSTPTTQSTPTTGATGEGTATPQPGQTTNSEGQAPQTGQTGQPGEGEAPAQGTQNGSEGQKGENKGSFLDTLGEAVKNEPSPPNDDSPYVADSDSSNNYDDYDEEQKQKFKAFEDLLHKAKGDPNARNQLGQLTEEQANRMRQLMEQMQRQQMQRNKERSNEQKAHNEEPKNQETKKPIGEQVRKELTRIKYEERLLEKALKNNKLLSETDKTFYKGLLHHRQRLSEMLKEGLYYSENLSHGDEAKAKAEKLKNLLANGGNTKKSTPTPNPKKPDKPAPEQQKKSALANNNNKEEGVKAGDLARGLKQTPLQAKQTGQPKEGGESAKNSSKGNPANPTAKGDPNRGERPVAKGVAKGLQPEGEGEKPDLNNSQAAVKDKAFRQPTLEEVRLAANLVGAKLNPNEIDARRKRAEEKEKGIKSFPKLKQALLGSLLPSDSNKDGEKLREGACYFRSGSMDALADLESGLGGKSLLRGMVLSDPKLRKLVEAELGADKPIRGQHTAASMVDKPAPKWSENPEEAPDHLAALERSAKAGQKNEPNFFGYFGNWVSRRHSEETYAAYLQQDGLSQGGIPA